MRVIFVGDISVGCSVNVKANVPIFFQEADLVFANLEGSVVLEQDRGLRKSKSFALYNALDVFETLKLFNVSAVYLANNHMYDVAAPVALTKDLLAQKGVTGFGAGATLCEASEPFTFCRDGVSVKAFAFGWDVIGCRLAGVDSEGVNPFTPKHLLATIRQLRRHDQTSFVVFVMHWNYELELYPQPAHRQLAHDLIHEGVDAVIGLHPHVAQGAELVDGKPVVYSLGNWFFPNRQLGHLRLEYPSIASRELAVEFAVEGRQARDVRFHWHEFDAKRNEIWFEQTEGWDGEILAQLTPYIGMSHKEYIRWFKMNRTRRRGLPIYKDYHQFRRNRIKDVCVKLRQNAIQALVHLRVKGGPRG